MEPILILPLLVSFLVCFLMIPSWIKRAKKAGLEGKDMNKYNGPKVAEAGGVIVVTGFIIGVLIYVALRTFYFKETGDLIKIFALLCSVIIIAFIGMIDDILGWKIGLSKKIRLILVLFGAIPLIVINAGHPTVAFPLIGEVSLGWIYSLIFIPLVIVGTSTTFNFLAGFNGLEAGQGIIILSFMSLIAYLTGSSWLAVIGMIMVFSLMAFYYYNKVPAKIFPGDVLTYPVGAMIGIMAILGNFERIALVIFIPYILEVILKCRGKLNKESFAVPQKDGTIKMPYEKIYGLTHLAVAILKRFKKDVREKDVVYLILLFQIAICVLSLMIFRGALFG